MNTLKGGLDKIYLFGCGSTQETRISSLKLRGSTDKKYIKMNDIIIYSHEERLKKQFLSLEFEKVTLTF